MSFLQKLGGRKFLIALVATGIATFVELHSPTGITATFATFLASMVAAFSVANITATAKYMDASSDSPPSAGIDPELKAKVDQIHTMVDSGTNPEMISKFTQILVDMNQSTNDLKGTVGQMGVNLVHLSNTLSRK